MPKKASKSKKNTKLVVRRVVRVQRKPQMAMSRLNTLPGAYGANVKASCTILSRAANTMRVRGKDLVYRIPDTLLSAENPMFCCIPANPAYWKGTRVANFATAYMNYRPIRMTFSYVPQVSAMAEGTIVAGTLWNGSTLPTDMQQTLVTSNGGGMVQCYLPADFHVTLGSNLQQNLYTLNGDLNPDTCPFIFVAMVQGLAKVPGYFFVSYEFEFKNPIGLGYQYDSGMVTDVSTYSPPFGNASLVLRQPVLDDSGNQVLGAGTVIDVEEEPPADGNVTGERLRKFLYRGSEIAKFLLKNIVAWYFLNKQGSFQASASASEAQVKQLLERVRALEAENASLKSQVESLNGQ